MGTKIQCKTYLPGFFSMADLNSNATNAPWLLNHENKLRKNSQCTDSVMPPQPVDGYFQYDKEKVRQTILKQETIFRHQLQELHRLYGRQRDLMNEHRMKEALNHRAKTFQSSPSVSHVPYPDMKRTWKVSHFPSLDSIADQLSTTDAANNRSSFHFIENDSRSSHFPSQVAKTSKELEFHQPSNSFFGGKMFDSRFVVDAKTPVKSSLEFPSGADSRRPHFSKRTDELADLNKPLLLEEAPPLVPDMNIRTITCLEDEQLTFNFNADQGQKQPDNESSGRIDTAGNLPKAFQSSHSHGIFKNSAFKEAKTDHQRKKRIFGVEILEEDQMQSSRCTNVDNSTHKSQPLSRTYTELLQDLEAYRGNMYMTSDVGSPSSSKDVVSDRSQLISKEVRGCEFASGRENCYHLSLDSLQNYSQQFFRREDTAVDSSQIRGEKPEVRDTTIFGVPIFSALRAPGAFSNTTLPDVDSTVTATKQTVCRSEVDATDFVQEKGINGRSSGLRHQIDLNMSLDEEERPLLPPLTEIDLEAPAVLESEAEYENSKHASEEFDELNEEAMRLAAESIISISTSGAHEEMNDALQNERNDCLKWFAELVSSRSSGTVCEFDEESIPEGFDYFEFMTLQLEEMKEEEYYIIPTLLNNEETGGVTLPKRPRRGQARRGRQRKDFQRDVLPGIVSLSRYEVTKDILTFEELFKTSGLPWQTSLSHRKNGKSGRGKKRLEGADPSPTIPEDRTPLINQHCSSELGIEEKNLTGWGKRTRRLPRQRYINTNLKRC